jgi:hypothetical protein
LFNPGLIYFCKIFINDPTISSVSSYWLSETISVTVGKTGKQHQEPSGGERMQDETEQANLIRRTSISYKTFEHEKKKVAVAADYPDLPGLSGCLVAKSGNQTNRWSRNHRIAGLHPESDF